VRACLLEESTFGSTVSPGAARRKRVLAVCFNADSCAFIDEAEQLDEQCRYDFTLLMSELCQKARSGAPIASCFGQGTWRDLGTEVIQCESGVISVPIFRLSRGGVAIIGFVARETDVVMFACRTGRTALKQTEFAHLKSAIYAFCECQRLGTLSFEQ
jgi:hypothetical protein